MKELRSLWLLFTSEGDLECELYRQIGATSPVMQPLYWFVVVKKEPNPAMKLSI